MQEKVVVGGGEGIPFCVDLLACDWQSVSQSVSGGKAKALGRTGASPASQPASHGRTLSRAQKFPGLAGWLPTYL